MRLVTAEHAGRRFAGVLDGGDVVPLRGLDELGAATPSTVLAVAARDERGRLPLSEVRLRPVVPRPGKIVCVGQNYAEHVEEMGRATGDYPVLFTKFAASLTGPYDPIPLPPESREVDYEGELAIVIGSAGRRIRPERWLDHVAGFAVANDVSMRDFQYRTSQWLQGKAWDASTPLGPALVTPDEIDPENLRLVTTVNGRVLQDARTSQLIFDLPTLVATISEFAVLEPGDVILTGTPGGVGSKRVPPVLLGEGDVVAVEIDGIGRIENVLRAETPA
jgi:acylpyruvate hydrolase